VNPFDGPVDPQKLEEYLLSPANAAVHPPTSDLSHPLKDYLISSSHNTYILGNQLYGDASTEGYKSVLIRGCRSIEVDCWDGEHDEPKVVHGYSRLKKREMMVRYTAVEPILFRAVCQTIAKYAFVTTELPVIISLEVHCKMEQQKKMVQVECPAAIFLSERFWPKNSETCS